MNAFSMVTDCRSSSFNALVGRRNVLSACDEPTLGETGDGIPTRLIFSAANALITRFSSFALNVESTSSILGLQLLGGLFTSKVRRPMLLHILEYEWCPLQQYTEVVEHASRECLLNF